ncbi:MAG TPA: hypothetical protein DCZ13_08805 [Porticoccaceae bacterium]|nr:hypothetical protein [Porticoccaceae bacterium]
MTQVDGKTRVCQLCGISDNERTLIPGAVVRPSVAAVIHQANPGWSDSGFICLDDLGRYRARYVESLLETEKGELSSLEQDVIAALQRHETITERLETEFEQQLSFGERLSDRVASFGGSWNFIITFAFVLFFWVLINSLILLWRPFDPYPFILLNLILSCLAALQAPIIMMSQNRQEAKDRLRSEHDYRINLKAELEIRHLHEKIDHLLKHQWERLVEIQQVQLEILNEFRDGMRHVDQP